MWWELYVGNIVGWNSLDVSAESFTCKSVAGIAQEIK